MNEIPYAVFEGTQIRHERITKRLIIALIIAVVLIFASNAIWLYAWTQYDYESEQTIIKQDTQDGGNANYIGTNRDGDVINGSSSSDSE